MFFGFQVGSAPEAGSPLFWAILILFLWLAMRGFKKMYKAFDDTGAVKDTAKQGIIGLINRLMKK